MSTLDFTGIVQYRITRGNVTEDFPITITLSELESHLKPLLTDHSVTSVTVYPMVEL